MTLSIIIDADGNAAIATVDKLGKAVKKTGKATEDMGRKSVKAGTDVKAVGGAAGVADAKVDALSAAERRNAGAVTEMGAASRRSAGNIGNMGAQFNDIGVMFAAGQSPLQMAIQQGTQINQLWGPGGIGKNLGLVRAGIASMITPMSLLTIGTIAGAAALGQWAIGLMSSENAGESYADTLDRVEGALSEYFALINSNDSYGAREFAEARENVEATSQAYRDLIAIAKIDALNGIGELTQSLQDAAVNASLGFLQGNVADAGDLFNINTALEGNITAWKDGREAAQTFIDVLDNMASAGSLDQQYAAATQLRDMFKENVDINGQMTDRQREFWRNLSQSILQMELLGAASDEVLSLTREELRTQLQIEGTRDRMLDRAARMSEQELQVAGNIGEAGRNLVFNADQIAENERLTQLMQGGMSAVTIQAIQLAGVDLASPVLTAADKTALLEAGLDDSVIKALELAGMDMGGGIRGAVSDAQSLADWLGIALSQALSLQNLTPMMSDEDLAMSQTVIPTAADRENQRNALQNFGRLTAPPRSPSSRTGSTGGANNAAREAEREQKAIDNLIGSLEDELAILRETDPIQKEMLRNRDTLANASAAEREQIEQLIAARTREAEVTERQEELWQETKSAAQGFFNDLRSSSGGLEEALGGISDILLDLIQQAILFGEGPLAGLMGFGSGGGIIDMAFGAVFGGGGKKGLSLPAKADGGKIYGPGSGTSDDVLMWGSNGEFMMNAKATQKYQPVLELMNAGALPAYAQGGAIGRTSTPAAYPNAPVSFVVENHGTPQAGEVQEESDGRGGRRFKLILADEVGASLTTKGGGARKALTQGYGVRPTRARR